MEIFGNSKKILINEMKRLVREYINKSTTKNDKNIILDSICSIMNICNIEKYEMPLLRNFEKKNKNIIIKSTEMYNKYENSLFKDIVKNKEYYNDIFYKACITLSKKLKNLEYPIYAEERFSEKELYEMLHDFFYENHQKDMEFVDSIIKEGRIIKVLDDGDYLGMCNCIYKNNPIITIYSQSNEKYTLEELVTIIHELGHAIDFKNLSLRSTSNTLKKYLITSKLLEFNSQFYEKQAYEYFLEKGIDKNSNLANFIAFYIEIYNNTYEALLFTTLEEKDILKRYYDYCNMEQFSNILFTDENHFYNLENITETLKYSIGGILAIYCDAKIKGNYDEGIKIYNKIMGIRTYGFDIKTIEELNIEPQEINKVIKKEIDRLRKF